MSRNLLRKDCAICYSDDIEIEEPPRPIKPHECRGYEKEYVGQLEVANARCKNCDAKYLAWVRHRFTGSGPHDKWSREPFGDGPPFVDLSFRAAFNDEPAAEDLPTVEKLAEIHSERQRKHAADLRRAAAELLDEAAAAEKLATDGQSFWEAYRR